MKLKKQKKAWTHSKHGKKVFEGFYEKTKKAGRVFSLINGKLDKTYSSFQAAKKDGWKY